MSGRAGQTSLFPPEPAPDPLLCWLWLAHVLGPASVHAGRVLDAFGGAQEAWEARDTAEFRLAAGEAAALRAQRPAHSGAVGHPDEAGAFRPGAVHAGQAVCDKIV